MAPSAADVCAPGRHDCEQVCVRDGLLYSCDCHQGYTLNPDGKTCSSKSRLLIPAPCALPCMHCHSSCWCMDVLVSVWGTFTCTQVLKDSSTSLCLAHFEQKSEIQRTLYVTMSVNTHHAVFVNLEIRPLLIYVIFSKPRTEKLLKREELGLVTHFAVLWNVYTTMQDTLRWCPSLQAEFHLAVPSFSSSVTLCYSKNVIIPEAFLSFPVLL